MLQLWNVHFVTTLSLLSLLIQINTFNKIIAFKMLSERISAILWRLDMLNLKATSFEMRGQGITDEGVGDYWWGGRGLLMSWQRITDEGAADYWHRAGVGVTKAPFVNFPVSKIFDLAKVPVRLFVSHSYLTGVTTAELWQHLSNMNTIFNR